MKSFVKNKGPRKSYAGKIITSYAEMSLPKAKQCDITITFGVEVV